MSLTPDDNDRFRDGTLDLADPFEGAVELPADRNGALKKINGAVGEPWPDPVPIGQTSPPDFPVDVFTPWVGDWVEAISAEAQTPTAMAAFGALGAVSIALQRKLEVSPLGNNWTCPVNGFYCTVLGPANRKSSVNKAASYPIRREETRLVDEGKPDRYRALKRRERLKSQVEAKEKEAMREADDELAENILREAARIKSQLDDEPEPVTPQLMVDNVTPERLVGLLKVQGERMGVMSAEGTLFELMAGRYSQKGPQLEVFLQAHDAEEVRVDRMNRESEHLRKPALTLALNVQEDVLRKATSNSQFRGRGMLGRFWWAVPDSPVGTRSARGITAPQHVLTDYCEGVTDLLQIPLPDDPVVAQFDSRAMQVFEAFHDEIEARMAVGGDLEYMRDWAGKLAGHAARLAGLFAAMDSRGLPRVVLAEHVLSATVVAHWGIPHAQRAYAITGQDQVTGDALEVLDWIRRERVTTVSRRQVHRALHRRFDKARDAAAALELLAENGWLRGKGEQEDRRRPHARASYDVHPLTHGRPR